jgi:hypothetical protein
MAFRQNIEKWSLKIPIHPLILKVFICGTQFHPMHPQKKKHRGMKTKGNVNKRGKTKKWDRKGPKCNHSIYDYMQLLVICNYI